MFEKEIKFIYDFNSDKAKKLGSYFTYEQLTSVDIHPAILHYISSEIDYLIFEDRQKLLSDSVFDYSGEITAKYFSLISEEIKKTKRFSLNYISKLILHASSFTVNYLARPKWALIKFLFDEKTHKSTAEIKQILGYIYYYGYLKKLLISYLNRKKIISINVDELETLIGKVDRLGIETYSHNILDTAIKSMSEFFNTGSVYKNKIPAQAIDLFLREKNLTSHLQLLHGEYPGHAKTKYEISDLRKLLFTIVPNKIEYIDLKSDASEEFIEEPILVEDDISTPENLEEYELEKDNTGEDVSEQKDIASKIEDDIPSLEDEETFTEVEDDEKIDFEPEEPIDIRIEDEGKLDHPNIDEQSETAETEIKSEMEAPQITTSLEIDKPFIEEETEEISAIQFEHEKIEEVHISESESSEELVDEYAKEKTRSEEELILEIDSDEDLSQLTEEEPLKESEPEFEFVEEPFESVEKIFGEKKSEESTEVEEPLIEEESKEEGGESIVTNKAFNPDDFFFTNGLVSEEKEIESITMGQDDSIEITEFESEVPEEIFEESDLDFQDDEMNQLERGVLESSLLQSEEVDQDNLSDKEPETGARSSVESDRDPELPLSEDKSISEDDIDEIFSDDFIEEVSVEDEKEVVVKSEELISEKEIEKLAEEFDQDEVEELLISEADKVTFSESEDDVIDEIKLADSNEEWVDEELGIDEEALELPPPQMDISQLLENKDMSGVIEVVFDYDMEDFANTIEKISEFENQNEAFIFLDDLLKTNRVDPSSKEVKVFRSIISEYFKKKLI